LLIFSLKINQVAITRRYQRKKLGAIKDLHQYTTVRPPGFGYTILSLREKDYSFANLLDQKRKAAFFRDVSCLFFLLFFFCFFGKACEEYTLSMSCARDTL